MPAWSSVLFACMALLPGVSSPVSLSSVQLACTVATALTELVLALGSHRLAPLGSRRTLVYLAGVLGAAGTCCVALAGSGALPGAALPFGYVCVGLGMGALTCSWLERLAMQGRSIVAWTLVVCTPLGYLACLLVDALPFQAAVPLAAALPVGAALLVPVGASGGEVPDGQVRPIASLRENVTRAPWRLFIVVLLTSVAYGFIRATSVVGGAFTSSAGGLALQQLFDFAGLCVGVSLALFAWKIRTAPAFYPVFAFIAVGGLLLSGGEGAPHASAAAISHVGITLISTIAIFLIMDAARGGKISALFGVGVLKFCEMVGVMLGQVSVELFLAKGAVAVAVLLVLLVAAFVVMSGSDAFSIIGEPPLRKGPGTAPAISAGSDDACDADAAHTADDARIDRICRIADKFGLSSREAQILELWGMGHTSAYIERELSISKNTVKTHLSHIYSKLGVASKEELLALVGDQTRTEPSRRAAGSSPTR